VHLLGLGEQRPDPARGRAAFAKVGRTIANTGYESYIVSDYGRTVTFNVAGDELMLTSTPYFYFWHRLGTSAEFQANGDKLITERIVREYEHDRAAGQVVSNESWCRAKLDRLETSAPFEDLSKSPGFASLRAWSQRSSETDPCGMLVTVRYLLEQTRIVHMKELRLCQ
jgi:hypothetical protein